MMMGVQDDDGTEVAEVAELGPSPPTPSFSTFPAHFFFPFLFIHAM